jgi:hypothetical protein
VVFVVNAYLFVAALACWVPRDDSCPRLTPVAPGPAIFPVFGAPAITSRSDLAVAQTLSSPDSRVQPEELACWTGVEAGAGAKKRDELDLPIHPKPSATANAPVDKRGVEPLGTRGRSRDHELVPTRSPDLVIT